METETNPTRLDGEKTTQTIVDGMRVYYNFIRSHQGLKGKTPAEACGITVKGKNVRVWFSREVARFCALSFQYGDLTDNIFRELGASPSVEGTISDVIDSPFGIMLRDISLWKIEETESIIKKQARKVTRVEADIKEMFIPMSEISRMDFL